MSDAPTAPRREVALRRCDLHLHTRYSSWRHARVLRARDSYSHPVEVYERARAAGMDYVALTDHDSIEGALRLLEARPDAAGRVIIGEEVETRFPDTGQPVHVNVFGLDETVHREIRRVRSNVHDLVAFARQRRLLHVLNHPFWSYRFQKRPRAYVDSILDLFTHFEAGNSTMPSGSAAAVEAMLRYAAALGLRKTAVAGSDAHVPDHVGSSFTVAAGHTPAAWLASVARGECAYRTRPIGFPRLLAHIHRAVAAYYRELAAAGGRQGMTAINYVAAGVFLPGAVLGVPALLASLNEVKQRCVLALARRSLERISAAAATPVEALD